MPEDKYYICNENIDMYICNFGRLQISKGALFRDILGGWRIVCIRTNYILPVHAFNIVKESMTLISKEKADELKSSKLD